MLSDIDWVTMGVICIVVIQNIHSLFQGVGEDVEKYDELKICFLSVLICILEFSP